MEKSGHPQIHKVWSGGLWHEIQVNKVEIDGGGYRGRGIDIAFVLAGTMVNNQSHCLQTQILFDEFFRLVHIGDLIDQFGIQGLLGSINSPIRQLFDFIPIQLLSVVFNGGNKSLMEIVDGFLEDLPLVLRQSPKR